MAKRKNDGRAMTMPGGLAVGAAVSLGITVALAALLARLLQKEILGRDQIGYGVMLLLLTASFLGAWVAQGRVMHRRVMVCALAGVVYFLLLLGITALFFGGQYSGMGVSALVVLAGSGSAALMSGRRGKGSRKRPKIRQVPHQFRKVG